MDGDRDGKRTSASEYAKRLWLKAEREPQRFVSALSDYDEAVAAQAASLLTAGGITLDEPLLQAAGKKAGRMSSAGFRAFLQAWRDMKIAGPAESRTPPNSNLETLDRQLASEDAASLAKAARDRGDAARGALLFHQHSLACTKCHSTGQPSDPLVGPDLTKPEKSIDVAHLVDSILRPSKALRQGYQSISIVTHEAETITGVLVEENNDILAIRDVNRPTELIRIPKTAIARRRASDVSIMPEGLIANLSDRQQFLDLVRYLIEIAEHGPDRASQLRPPTAFLYRRSLAGLRTPRGPRRHDRLARSQKLRARRGDLPPGAAPTATAQRISPARSRRRCDSPTGNSKTAATRTACIKRSRTASA